LKAARSVLFVAPSAYGLGGLATWLDYLVPALEERGWIARLGLVSGRRHHRPDKYLELHRFDSPLTAHCDTDTPVGRRLALEKLLREANPDVVVSVNIPDVIVAANSLRATAGPDLKVVMSVHGIERHLYADMHRYRDAIDGVICTNRLACALSESMGEIPQGRVYYAACGVELPKRVPEERAMDQLRVVYSGRLETPQKRSLDLIEVVGNLRQRGVPYHLDVVGDGPDREALAELLEPEVQARRVTMHGFLPAEVLHSTVYASADVMLVTSEWETGPIVAWEAMAHDICLVSSRYVGSVLEGALQHGVNAMLFPVGDTATATSVLESLVQNAGLRSTLRQGGDRLVKERYSQKISADSWSDALIEVLAGAPRSAVSLPVPGVRGRLDRLFGAERGEIIRRVFGTRRSTTGDPGGEWPHSHSAAVSDEAFWQAARRADSASESREEASFWPA
jgi:glycosyltransferase involved in cell wall biosynthesis